MNRARVQSLPSQNGQENTPLQNQNVSAAVRLRLKRRSKIRKIFLFCFVAWAAYVFLFVQTPSLHRLNQQQVGLSAQVDQVNKTNQDLQKQIQQLYDPTYIAELARKKYLMVKNGETLFVEPKPQP